MRSRTWKTCVLHAVILLAAVCPLASAQIATFGEPEPVKRELTVYWTDSPPAIDGDLSDPLWQRHPRVTGMVDITFRHAYVLDQTLFVVAYDSYNMYLGIDCRDRYPERIRATVRERDGHLWGPGDDTFEIFLEPDGTGKRYIQLAFNPLGTQWDFRKDKTVPEFTGWDGNWRVATRRTRTGWTAEVAFPFADLPMGTPEPGFRLKANVSRYRRSEKTDPFSSWSVLTGSFHNTREFGDWIFAAPGIQPSRSDEMAINEEFVAVESRSLAALPVRTQREAALVESLPAGARTPALADQIGDAQARSADLMKQAKDLVTLDGLLEARITAHRLEEALRSVALQLSLAGLAGPIDGLEAPQRGIRREGRYWLLSGPRGVHAVVAESGAMAGAWDRKIGRRVVAASYDLYSLERRDEKTRADERSDVVEAAEHAGNVLTLSCRNPDLPGLEIVKRYELLEAGKMLSKRVSVSAAVQEMTLLGISSNTIFDPEFRRGSLYNRTMAAGVSGGSDHRPTIPADEITGEIIQRGGNNKACGWAQFVLANATADSGVAQYLYKMNGRYVWSPYGMTSSYWNAHGWEMSVLGTFLEDEPFSAETRYHLFDGDQVEFYHEYLQLPEVKAARAELPVDPDIAGLRAEGEGLTVTSAFDSRFPDEANPRIAVPHDRLRSDEINLMWGIPRHNIFSHWPSSDDDYLRWIDPTTKKETRVNVGEVRKAAERVRQRFPRHLLSLYWVHTDLHPDSETFREHPEFAIRNKDGALVPATHPYGAYEADMSKEFTDYAVPRYGKMVDHLGLGFLYFDFFGGSSLPDWGQGRVLQTTDYMYFDRSVRQMLGERGAFVFYNGNPGQLYCDINYAESLGAIPRMDAMGKDWWRWHHERLMYFKLLERDNMTTILLLWLNYRQGPRKEAGEENDREYTNLILALGLRPHTCYYEYGLELKREDGTVDWSRMYNYEAPYKEASLEMHNARIANVALQPRYWSDPDSTVEAYVLRKGPAYFFTAINHKDEPADLALSADAARLGFEPGRRLFRWDYTRRDDTKVPRTIGPETPGWDRLFTNIRCSSSIAGKEPRLSVPFPDAEPNYTYLATLTQVPGVFVSVEGKELQFRLPQALRCSLDGEVDENDRRVVLRAKTSKPSAVAAWWPDSWGRPRVRIDGEATGPPEFLSYGRERFVAVPVPRGTCEITLSVE